MECHQLVDCSEWTAGFEAGQGLPADLQAFLASHQRQTTFYHCQQVAREAARLAVRFEIDASQAEQAGWLHDASVVIPNQRRLEVARQWGLAVLAEEAAYPMLLHQRLSVVLAREVFGVRAAGVLSAIACHTTLRPHASPLDMVVFVADKIAWDQAGGPPYLASLLAALEISLASAAGVYLRYLSQHASGPLHPWAREALLSLPA